MLARDRVRAGIVRGEDEHPRGPMTIEQSAQRVALRPGQGEEPSGLAPGGERTPPLRRPAGGADEVRPGRLRERLAECRVGGREQPMEIRVVDSLLVGQVHVEGDHIEARQEPTGQVADREFVDGRPDEVRQASRVGWVPGRRRGQAESGARKRHLQRLIAEAASEVMDLVDDQEAEAGSDAVHVSIGTFVRGDRDGRHLAAPLPVAADLVRIHGRDLLTPLLEEHTGGDQAERRQARRRHGGEGNAGLAAPGGEHDETPSPGELPREEGSGLILAQTGIGPSLRRLVVAQTAGVERDASLE